MFWRKIIDQRNESSLCNTLGKCLSSMRGLRSRRQLTIEGDVRRCGSVRLGWWLGNCVRSYQLSAFAAGSLLKRHLHWKVWEVFKLFWQFRVCHTFFFFIIIDCIHKIRRWLSSSSQSAVCWYDQENLLISATSVVSKISFFVLLQGFRRLNLLFYCPPTYIHSKRKYPGINSC